MELSQYAKSLDEISKKRYLSKIKKIGRDPYLFSFASKKMPTNVSSYQSHSYLLKRKSTYSGKENCNSNSIMKAEGLFEAGWLKDLAGVLVGNSYVVLGKVSHSQRLNEKPLEAWVIVSCEGAIGSAHCQCKAGLFETCTHVAIILYALNAIQRGCASSREPLSVTDVACYWRKAPIKRQLHAEIRSLDFKKKRSSSFSRIYSRPPLIDSNKKIEILRAINTSLPPAALTLCRDFMIQEDIEFHFTQYYFANIFKVEYCSNNYSKELLQQIGRNLQFTIPCEDVSKIEKLTRLQSLSADNIWHKLRLGRITASVFKEVCRTNKLNPSKSLLNKICMFNSTLSETKMTHSM